jgi:ASPIC and UnbV
VRADAGLSRRSFRLSEAWKRRGAAGLAPEIDSRLAGVEKRGDKTVVHSLSGKERNHYFANRAGKSFTDLSALSGLDNLADSRGWALLDYDRDGWQDVALVNANEPLFNLYHNNMPASALRGGIVAVKFVGGNQTAAPSAYACRDGYGAVLTAALGDITLTREHRCGDGFAAQHSAVMMLGLGERKEAKTITVRWPSGKTATVENVAEGTLLTCFENPADAPDGTAFTRGQWRPAAR